MHIAVLPGHIGPEATAHVDMSSQFYSEWRACVDDIALSEAYLRRILANHPNRTSEERAPTTPQMATISECRYRWLRVPATTFIITHSPSRSNRRDRFSFSEERKRPGDGAGSSYRRRDQVHRK